MDYSPWGCKESDMTEQLSLSHGLLGFWIQTKLGLSHFPKASIGHYEAILCIKRLTNIWYMAANLQDGLQRPTLPAAVWSPPTVRQCWSYMISIIRQKWTVCDSWGQDVKSTAAFALLFLFIYFYLFTYFLQHWVFAAVCRLPLVVRLLPSCDVQASRCRGLSCCRAQALGNGFQ